MKKLQIGIIGSAGPEEYPENSKPEKEIFEFAERLGQLVAENEAILVTGGKGGVMEMAAKGAKRADGITVGIIKESKTGFANNYIDIEVTTGMAGGDGLTIMIMMCDGIIAVGGGAGTLQEIAIAYRLAKPIVAINNLPGIAQKFAGTYLDGRKTVKILSANSPEKALKLLFKQIK